MTALEMKKPGIIFRGTILLAQGNFIFWENYYRFDESVSHRDYNKILQSDWLSAVLISTLIGQLLLNKFYFSLRLEKKTSRNIVFSSWDYHNWLNFAGNRTSCCPILSLKLIKLVVKLICMTPARGHPILVKRSYDDMPNWTPLRTNITITYKPVFLVLHFVRHFCELVFPGLRHESQVLPQICWIFGGRSSQNLHSLSWGIYSSFLNCLQFSAFRLLRP